jgi:hypothetical protein
VSRARVCVNTALKVEPALRVMTLALLAATPVRLQYVRAEDAAACIAEDALREAVLRRLGYMPFDDAATDVLEVTVTRRAPGFVARLMRTRGERELYTPRADCADLGEALAFAISVAIDPASMFAPAAAPDAGAAPPPAEVEPRRPAIAAVPDAGVTEAAAETRLPAALEVGVGLGAAYGLGPIASLSVRGELRWRWALFSLGLHLRGDVLGRLRVGDGSVSATPVQAGVAGCFHWGGLSACALVSGGLVISGASELPEAVTRVTPIFQLGGRLAYALVLGRWQPFAYAEGGGTVARTSLFVGDTAAWTAPPAWGGAGLGLFFGSP